MPIRHFPVILSIVQPQMEYKIVVDLTEVEQLCFNCRALLEDGPKHRIHGYLLCNECADIVSLLRVHNWRVCLVCALAGEADDIDCADIQNFRDGLVSRCSCGVEQRTQNLTVLVYVCEAV
ncbi:hypothetical protein HC256_006639 [Beauveria bassiana]|nr:hypothetical protein HC256_006639 [Beauveria bassiana]